MILLKRNGTVVDVVWSASKDKYLKPKIYVNEVKCDGSKINCVTGFNAKYIQENHIGPGSILTIGLSGGVIPHVFDIITTSSTGVGKLPDKSIVGEYFWNESGVDIILQKETKEVLLKKALIFLKSLDIDMIGIGIMKLIFFDDSISSILDILLLNHDQWVSYPKIGEKKYILIHDSFSTKLPIGGLVEYVYGSQILDRNFGMRKLHTIFKDLGRHDSDAFLGMHDNDFVLKNKHRIHAVIRDCNGISDRSASAFIDRIQSFNSWMKNVKDQTDKFTDYDVPSVETLYQRYHDCHVNIQTDHKSSTPVAGNVVLTGLRHV